MVAFLSKSIFLGVCKVIVCPTVPSPIALFKVKIWPTIVKIFAFEDVLEDTAEKIEDTAEFLMRPEVLSCILVLLIVICIIMYLMKRDDEVESYKIV